MTHPIHSADAAEQVQWRNIQKVVRELAAFCFGGPTQDGIIQLSSAYVAIVNSLTAKDGANLKLEPLPRAAAQVCANGAADLMADIKKAIRLADAVGVSRADNRYARNERAVKELVELEISIERRLAAGAPAETTKQRQHRSVDEWETSDGWKNITAAEEIRLRAEPCGYGYRYEFRDAPAETPKPLGQDDAGLPAKAWVTPLRYGSQVTFYQPPKPANWDDDEEKWYCYPLVRAAPAATIGAGEGKDALLAELCALLPGPCYMDPPDGGDTPVMKQIGRMALDAARWRHVRPMFRYVHIDKGVNGHAIPEPIPGDDMEIDDAVDAAANTNLRIDPTQMRRK